MLASASLTPPMLQQLLEGEESGECNLCSTTGTSIVHGPGGHSISSGAQENRY